MLPRATTAPTRPAGPAGPAGPPGPRPTQTQRRRTRRIRAPAASAAPATDAAEEIHLELVATQRDDRRAQSPPTSPHTRPPAVSRRLISALTYSSLVLENSGNLARDHLSTERTWLAYMRTSLLMTATGVGLVQFFAMTLADTPPLEAQAVQFFGLSTAVQRFARPLGESAVILALCLVFLGLQRYFSLQRAVMQGTFPAATAMVLLLSAALAVIVVVTCGVLLTLP